MLFKFFMIHFLTFIFSTSLVAASALDIKQKGKVKVEFNDKIGQNQFVFLSEAPFEKIQGTADGIEGYFETDTQNLEQITGLLKVPVKLMKTGNKTRDKHLKSKKWLNQKKYPFIEFKISSAKAVSVNGKKVQLTAVGEFSLHGVTKNMEIPISLTWLEETEKTKAKASGDFVKISSKFNIGLEDFKIKGKKGVVGKKVCKTIELKGTLYGHTVK